MKALFSLLFVLFITPVVYSQPDNGGKKNKKEKREWIKSQKVTYISNELVLTSEEAEVFWPIYNEYEQKAEVLRNRKRKTLRALKKVDEMSNDEAYQKMEDLLALEIEMANLRSEYLSKFADVLDKKRATKVYIAEEKFKRELIKKMYNKGPENDGQNPPPPPRD